MKIVMLDADPAIGSARAPELPSLEDQLEPLRALGELQVFAGTKPEAVLSRCQDAEVVITNKVLLNAELLSKLPSLQLVSILATGTNAVDLVAAKKFNIQVCNVPAYSTHSTAQHALALLLELCSRTYQHIEDVQAGSWAMSPAFSYYLAPTYELAGKTLGIIGYGAIGQQFARLGAALGMEVLVHTRSPRADGGEVLGLEELLRRSDVVSLHCPLTSETRGLIDHKRLSWMKPSAFLINVARGPLIDEGALATALENGKLGGAGLDVLCEEPPSPQNPLLHAPRVLITPHIAWATVEARKRLLAVTAENVRCFLAGQPQNLVTA